MNWDTPGGAWDSGAWDSPPSPPTLPYFQIKPQPHRTMKRQNYFPSRIADQVNWLENFGNKITIHGASVGLDAPTVAAARNDALWGHYVLGTWLTAVRAFAPSTTEAVDIALNGTGGAGVELPTFTAPDLPAADPTATPPVAAVTPALPGLLTRIFTLIALIKNNPGYTEAIGQDLRVIGPEDTTVIPVPKFLSQLLQGSGSQTVNLTFYKYGHMGVYIESKRGAAGAWEFLAIDTESPYTDERPLLTAGQPEVREYRMRYWDKGTPNGDWTDVQKVTVSP